MLKRLSLWLVLVFAALQFCGCTMVAAYVAEHAKEKRDVDFSYSEAIDVVKAGLKPAGVQFIRAHIVKDYAMVKGKYIPDGRTVRIVVTRVSETQSNIAVRVGTSEAGKENAQKIMAAILEYADLVKGRSSERGAGQADAAVSADAGG
jgi:hypothetical protein